MSNALTGTALPTPGFPPGGITPPEILGQVLNALLGGAPFADSLTRMLAGANSVTFPVASPTGMDWIHEGQPLPTVNLGDTAYNVVPRKLAGTFGLSNELLADETISAFDLLGTAVRDASGPVLDDGLLHGDGDPGPVGVVGLAPASTGTTLREAAITATADIGNDGGTANVLALNPTDIAAESARADANGRPLYENGFTTLGTLSVVAVPKLAAGTEMLVYDATRLYLLVRNDFLVEASPDAGFTSDLTIARIKGRFAAAVPTVNKSIRKLTVGP
jgi:HK97 family phage major capsid protein